MIVCYTTLDVLFHLLTDIIFMKEDGTSWYKAFGGPISQIFGHNKYPLKFRKIYILISRFVPIEEVPNPETRRYLFSTKRTDPEYPKGGRLEFTTAFSLVLILLIKLPNMFM